MNNAVSHNVHLVGSIPMESADEVFDLVGSTLRNCCRRIPDGETGDRKNWIGWQYDVFKGQDALIQSKLKEREYQLHPPFTFKPNHNPENLDFSNLGFAREARTSFSKFKKKQKSGIISDQAKFMVALPTPFAPVYSFISYADQEAILPHYEKAILGQIDEISNLIPHEKLVVQWDVATEMSIFENVYDATFENPWKILTDRLAALGNHIPANIELGYHLCYGSMNNKHWKEPENLEMCTKVANVISEKISRSIQFIHMPVPIDRSDDSYFAPLKELRLPEETEIILGLIHDSQNIQLNIDRIDAARIYLSEFGIATECGLGRRDASEMPRLMELHAELASH
jgi:hypothetical protein